MINRLRWWVSYRLAAHRAHRAGTVTAAALARRERERIRYSRP